VTTQAPPLRQSRDTFEGHKVTYVSEWYRMIQKLILFSLGQLIIDVKMNKLKDFFFVVTRRPHFETSSHVPVVLFMYTVRIC
jgi:hypothetical protein